MKAALREKLRRNVYLPICRVTRIGSVREKEREREIGANTRLCSRLINFARQVSSAAGILEDKRDHSKTIAHRTGCQI